MSENYDTLVLSGGSVNGFVILGTLQYLYDNDLLHHINTYIGTSIGSLISFLLIIGYDPVEIITYMCVNSFINKLKNINILAMIRGLGAISFNVVQEQLEKMTIDKIGYLPTLQEVKEKFGKVFICVTYNLTKNATEYLDYENNPSLSCITAIRMSANFPILFESIYKLTRRYKRNKYKFFII